MPMINENRVSRLRALLDELYTDGPTADYSGALAELMADLAAFCAVHGKPSYALVQQGGSSSELYLHAHPTRDEAEADRIDCALDGAYSTSEVVEVPAVLAALGEVFYAAVDEILGASTGLECVDACYTIQLGAGADVPLSEGGTGPDEPVWRFAGREDFDRAVALANACRIAFTEGRALLPEGESADSVADFAEYLDLQRE